MSASASPSPRPPVRVRFRVLSTPVFADTFLHWVPKSAMFLRTLGSREHDLQIYSTVQWIWSGFVVYKGVDLVISAWFLRSLITVATNINSLGQCKFAIL